MSLLKILKDIFDLILHGFTIDTDEIARSIHAEALEFAEHHAYGPRWGEFGHNPEYIGSEFNCNGSGYWIVFDNQEREGPFCKRCFERDGNLNLMQRDFSLLDDSPVYAWKCERCGLTCAPPAAASSSLEHTRDSNE